MLTAAILHFVREFPEPVLLVSITGDILASSPKARHLIGPGAVLGDLVVEPRTRLTEFLRLCARTSEITLGAFTVRAHSACRCRFEGSGMSLDPESPRSVWLKVLPHDQAVSPFLSLNERIERLKAALHAHTRAEDALRLQSAQFQTLLNQSPLGVYLVDSKLRILSMNPAAEENLGVIGAAVAGHSLEDAFRRTFPMALAEQTLAHFRHTLETGNPYIVGETTDQRIDPRETQRYYSWQIHRIPLPDNTNGLVCYFQDITARKQAEAGLRRTEKLAAVGRHAASIAHEINNPLEAVTNLLFLARTDSTVSEQTREYLRLADTELNRIAHLARQTLGFYRDSTAPILVQPATLIESLLALYEHRFRSRSVRLVTELQATPPIFAFAGEFRQVLSNLIANALDAMEPLNTVAGEESVLTLRTRASHSWREPRVAGVRITIADTGSGINPECLDRIFDAFFTTKKETGTGLGLWLCHEILQKHEGSIFVRSRGGRGTVFTLFWPAHPGTLNPPVPASESEESAAAV